MKSQVYLQSYLAPLAPWLSRPEVTDILINRPGELWVETNDGAPMHLVDVPELTEMLLDRLARQIAASSHQGVSREHPILSASLPDGSRIQIIGPPATRTGVAMSVRKHSIADLTIERLADSGMFRSARTGDADENLALDELLRGGNFQGFLTRAVHLKKTLILAGGTSSGKTTLLNALVKCIPEQERLIVIEDAPEIALTHPNSVGLLAARGETGEARIEPEDLVQASMRMRPDRLLLGEIRGSEAFSFLRAVNTGHPGSITTIHADSPKGALDQIAMLALLGGANISWSAIRTYACEMIDYVVQLRRSDAGRRVVQISSARDL